MGGRGLPGGRQDPAVRQRRLAPRTPSTSPPSGRASSGRIGTALPSLALTANTSDLTAIGNDYGFERVFARLIEAHGRAGRRGDRHLDLRQLAERDRGGRRGAGVVGIRTIGLLGKGGGKLAPLVELALVVPSPDTQRIQECHIAIGHAIAELVDRLLFPELARS